MEALPVIGSLEQILEVFGDWCLRQRLPLILQRFSSLPHNDFFFSATSPIPAASLFLLFEVMNIYPYFYTTLPILYLILSSILSLYLHH